MTNLAGTTGERIKQVRGSMSQDEFACRMAVHKETLGKYERNKRQPDAAFLIKIREEFGVSTDWLLTGHGTMCGGLAETPVEARPPTIKEVFNEGLMVEVFEAVSKTYRDGGVRIPERTLSQIASGTYSALVAAYDTADECRIGLKVMMEQLRRDLSKPVDETGTGKLSA